MGRRTPFVFLLGAAGAARFFGDAVITPTISVLSAVEGLEVVTPTVTPWVLPVTLAVLSMLFAVRSRGTGAVATWFGPRQRRTGRVASVRARSAARGSARRTFRPASASLFGPDGKAAIP